MRISRLPDPQRDTPLFANSYGSIGHSLRDLGQEELFPRQYLITSYINDALDTVVADRLGDAGRIGRVAYHDGFQTLDDGRGHDGREFGWVAHVYREGVVVCE